MNRKSNSQHWRKLVSLVLCIVQLLVLIPPAAHVLADTPDDRDYLLAAMPAQEGAEVGGASTMVTISEDPAWEGIHTQATIKAAEGITLIGDQKSVVIDSPINEGYANESGKTYPSFALSCGWGSLNTATQDIMFYVELPGNSSEMRIDYPTCNGWSFWVAPSGMEYQYLSVDSDGWETGRISTDGNNTIALAQGFHGYVRLRINTAENAAQFPDTTLQIQDVRFRLDRFGGDNGAFKMSGVWFVSKENFVKIQVGDAEPVKMTNTPEPEPRKYLLSTQPAKEGGEIGQASTMVTIGEDPAWAGIASQATMKAAEGITIIGDAKSTVIDSPISEGYANEGGKTYPAFVLNCGWGSLNTATQDIMFYIELPAASSEICLGGITCNGWSFWAAPSGMQYQYLTMDSNTWEDGTITTDGNKTLSLPQGFKGYVRLRVNTAENAANFPDTTLTIQDFSFTCDRFGGDYGALKLSGVWFVSKENYAKIQLGEEEPIKMTYAPDPDDPVAVDYLTAAVPAQESAEIGAASSLVAIDSDPAWAGIASQATMKAAAGITVIGDAKSAVIDSPISEGYFNESGKTYPNFALNCGWGSLNTATQDIMFYIELPTASSEIRLGGITCNSWSFWAAPSGMQYQYLAMDSDTWQDGTITTDGNKTLSLPQGFKGYVRLRVNTAENAASFPDTTLTVQNFTFTCDRFGGDYGALKLSGVWFVSKENYVKIQVGDAEPVKMTNAGDPIDPPDPDDPNPDDPDRDYITGTVAAQESAEIGAVSSLVVIDEDPAWAGIASQATMKAAEGITIIGDAKSTVIDSPISEGYFNESGKTYPAFALSYGWGSLNTATQDIMFYIELPAASSEIRLGGITCNGWSFWAAPSGMQYQYLAMDSDTWVDGTISTEGNKTLSLTQGFKGYVRLRVNTAENAASFPDTTLTVQNFTFTCDRFGGDYGALKLSGVWFVSKENYVKIQVGEGEAVKMTNAGDPIDPPDPDDPNPDDPNPDDPNPDDTDRDYITGTMPSRESAEIGAVSSLVTIDSDPAWAGIASQATMKAAAGITVIGDAKSTVIDSPISEGYFNESGKTYPNFALNCGWGSLNTATQDIMFYIELPKVSSGIRLGGITCNGWTFWAAPSGMQYQYLAMDSNKWENGTITTEGNKTLTLPQGFKGYVRLRVNTAENAASFPDTTLTVQNFTFTCDRFGGPNGPVKMSGVWFVSKEDFCNIRVDGAEKKEMTTYLTDNEAAINRFNELLGQLSAKDLSAAPIIDQLLSLYDTMSEEYRASVSAEELAKIEQYRAAVDAYRPTFLGVTVKKPGSAQQGLKAGWTADEALAKQCGYKIVSCGAVMQYNRDHNSNEVIDGNTPGAVTMRGTIANGVCSASVNIAKDDYYQDVLIRCYVVYEEISTGERFTVWCGSYKNQSGQANTYLQCSLFEVANYFGVPLFAK